MEYYGTLFNLQKISEYSKIVLCFIGGKLIER